MSDRVGRIPCFGVTKVTAAGVALLLLASNAALSQTAPPPPPALGVQQPAQQAAPPQPAPQQTEPPPPAQPENPGLINEIGKLFEKSKSLLPPIKSPTEAIEDFNARARDAAKDAGESLSSMARPSLMVKGRAACGVAANGAPDCKVGADKLCQSKGYKEGKSIDTDAAEKCSAKVYIPGRQRQPGDCRTENYVTRAVCQ